MLHLDRCGRALAALALACLVASGCSSGTDAGALGDDLAGSPGPAHSGEHAGYAEDGVGDDAPSPDRSGSKARAPLSIGIKECARGATPALGVHVGNDPQALVQFERWIGRPVDALQVHSGARNWEDWYDSISWQTHLWRGTDRRILWSIPLIPGTGTLVEAAKGTYDESYRRAARLLSTAYPKQGQIYIRVGWEFNGPWKPWSSIGLEPQFVASYRRFVDAFRSVSDRFVFEWTPNIGSHGNNPEDSYPGDDYVDLIGMDFYYNTAWHPVDNAAAWDYMLNQKYGLKWHQEFAARRGKRTAYSEWGVMTDGASEFIRLAAAWFRQHEVVYQNYWNSNSNFRGKLSDNQFPKAGARFKEEFGRPQACLP